jgi:hypothetical protein
MATKKQKRKAPGRSPPPAVERPGSARRGVAALLRRPARWLVGVVVGAVAILATGILTGIPGQLLDVPAIKDRLRSGPDLSVTAETVYLDDEGRSFATPRGVEPGAQLRRALRQPGAAASPDLVTKLRAAGGVSFAVLTLRLILEGRRNQQVDILDIRPDPASLRRAAPLAGTLFHVSAQGGSATLRMLVNLDEPVPVAREPRLDSATETQRPGAPFFENTTISLQDRERQVVVLRALTERYDATFRLRITYRIGDSDKVVLVDDGGRPFQVTAPSPGPAPDTWAYQEAYDLQGDFSLCRLADPQRIGRTGRACAS